MVQQRNPHKVNVSCRVKMMNDLEQKVLELVNKIEAVAHKVLGL